MPTEHDPGATVREWTDLVQRARIGREVKGVLMVLATYADSDGTRIFPGTARLAVDAEVSYNYAANVLAFAQRVELMQLTKRGNRRLRKADEFRLIIGAGIQDHIDVLSPPARQDAIDRARKVHGSVASEGPKGLLQAGRHHRSVPTGTGQKPTASVPSGSGQMNGSVPTETGQITAFSPDGDRTEVAHPDAISPVPVGTETSISPVSVHGSVPFRTGPTVSTKHRSQLRTEPTQVDLDTAVTHSRANPDEKPDLPLPPKCPHGFRPRHRNDGAPSCPLCRVAARMALEHPSGAFRIIRGGAPA